VRRCEKVEKFNSCSVQVHFVIQSYTDTHQTGTKPTCCNLEFLCQNFVKLYEGVIDFVKVCGNDGFIVIIIIRSGPE
jgi:hypothetical protein